MPNVDLMGYCPNCALELPLEAPECPRCKALFRDAEWKVVDLAPPPKHDGAKLPDRRTGLEKTLGILVAAPVLVVLVAPFMVVITGAPGIAAVAFVGLPVLVALAVMAGVARLLLWGANALARRRSAGH